MYPQALIDYLVHFHGDRDYFECHEILEEYWKSLPKNEKGDVWVGLIQIAVALYHQRRGNYAGARKMFAAALRRLRAQELNRLGLGGERLLSLLHRRMKAVEQKEAYDDLNLPIDDENLLQRCKDRAREWNIPWLAGSDLENEFLLHKHALRDRSEVSKTREEALAKRKKR
ncbi:DUF309 domain-containing protein [Bacillaceae bacterium]